MPSHFILADLYSFPRVAALKPNKGEFNVLKEMSSGLSVPLECMMEYVGMDEGKDGGVLHLPLPCQACLYFFFLFWPWNDS